MEKIEGPVARVWNVYYCTYENGENEPLLGTDGSFHDGSFHDGSLNDGALNTDPSMTICPEDLCEVVRLFSGGGLPAGRGLRRTSLYKWGRGEATENPVWRNWGKRRQSPQSPLSSYMVKGVDEGVRGNQATVRRKVHFDGGTT